ncbi:MAG: hypothetical protein IPM94_15345 [bacterium]|nr:hypothetical protein [bacterium]
MKNWEYLAQQKDRIRLLVTGHWNGELSYDGFAARVGYVRALWDGVQALCCARRDLRVAENQ